MLAEYVTTDTRGWVSVQAEDLTKTATKLRKRLDLSLTSTWRSFQDLVACLVASNALQAETLKALPLGHVARQIRGENELWLAMVLTHPAVQVSHASLFCGCLRSAHSWRLASKAPAVAAYIVVHYSMPCAW